MRPDGLGRATIRERIDGLKAIRNQAAVLIRDYSLFNGRIRIRASAGLTVTKEPTSRASRT